MEWREGAVEPGRVQFGASTREQLLDAGEEPGGQYTARSRVFIVSWHANKRAPPKWNEPSES